MLNPSRSRGEGKKKYYKKKEIVAPALVAVTKKKGYGVSTRVKVKGRKDKKAIQTVLRFMEGAGVSGKVTLGSYGEHSIISFVQEVSKQRR